MKGTGMNMQLDESGAKAWSASARHEYKAAAGFSALSLQLSALGAPVELVSRTQHAGMLALDQQQLCLEVLAGLGFEGHTGSMQGHVSDRVTEPNHTATAVQAFGAGVVTEGFAVNRLRRARSSARPEIAKAMGQLIVADQQQVACARDIVAWCVEQDPAAIVEVHAAARRLPTVPERVSALPTRTQHGVCGSTDAAAAWKETVLEAGWWLSTALV